MTKLRSIFATLKLLLVYTMLGPALGIVGIPYTLIVDDISWLYRSAMWVARAGVRAAGISVRHIGFENIPTGRASIFLCNHVSNLDPPILLPAIRLRCVVLLKRELMNIPILGTAMKLGGYIPIERGAVNVSRRESAQASVDAAGKALAAGLNILIFPEGTRSLDGRLANFKKGPFFLAQQTGAPIVPVAISGTEAMLPKGSVWIAPGVATVQMLPPIDPANFSSRDDLMAAVRAAIAGALPESMKPRSTT